MCEENDSLNIQRRNVLKAGLANAVISSTVLGQVACSAEMSEVLPILVEGDGALKLETGKTRPWIGPDFWSNRFQDWRLHEGKIECLTGAAGDELRTLGILTRDIQEGPGKTVRLAATFTPLTVGHENGFGGFMVGVGRGLLDYRAAALAQRGSGENGGFMAVVDTQGRVAFRDHTREGDELVYEPLSTQEAEQAGNLFRKNGVRLILEARRAAVGFDLTLVAKDPETQESISFARKLSVPETDLIGGISLLSSTNIGEQGARWSIADIDFSGDKLSVHPERALGPVMGTMYSLSDNKLKLSAQFMPLGEGDPERASLQVRSGEGGGWKTIATAKIELGYSALFRSDAWQSDRDWEYRVVYEGSETALWSGTVRKDPGKSRDLVVALYSCISSTGESLEGGGVGGGSGGGAAGTVALEQDLGRFTSKNFYFPHNSLRKNTQAHDPDILLVCGDQYYEGNPIRLGRENKETRNIDTLYRWYLWYWSFRDLTRDRPTIMLLDDHDVLQGNIWGHAGREAPEGSQNRGGFVHGIDLAHMVHRVQASHNPDAYDPTPVLNDIPVYYGAFLYGGVSFAVIEDRKWKTTPMFGTNLDAHVPQLLGERQEKFLADWKDMHPGAPKMIVTASIWGAPQTSPEGEPILDFDANGYPPLARRRAVQLAKDAGAVMVAGDQHLATIVRLGIDDFTDGPIQFSGPAGASYWQRWFDPIKPLPNARKGIKESGDFIDAFGNKMNIQAVANPKVTFAKFREYITGRSQSMKDPDLKSEGYGIIRISHRDEAFTFECWSKEEDPTLPNAKQYSGWPYRVGFDEV